MKIANVVADAREKLGPVGVFLPGPILSTPVPAEIQRRAVRSLEDAGVNAAWNNEVVYDKDAFVQLGLMLGSTNRMAFGTAIANIWARSPQTASVAAAALAEAYPGRFVLGLGVGYPVQANSVGRPWGSPLANVREYFERMDAPHPMRQVPDVAYPRILAARGPKMLALAAEIADGANPNGVPPEYTFRARQVLGPDKLLVVGVSTILEDDLFQARATAREDTQMMAQSGLVALALTGLGYSAEELSAGVGPIGRRTDRLRRTGSDRRKGAGTPRCWGRPRDDHATRIGLFRRVGSTWSTRPGVGGIEPNDSPY